MALNTYPLPKVVDERFLQYLIVPEDLSSSSRLSHHALRVAQNGKLDIYGDGVYDFSDPRFPGKGCFVNSSSQPIKIDGIKYHSAEHYLRVMSCEDPKEAANIFFSRSLQERPQRLRSDFTNHKKEFLETTVRAKISQHPDTAAELLATGNLYMAYTSPDNEYGTGFKGRGRNMLGEVYMDARDQMLRSILQNKKAGKIENPTPEQINELAQEFQDDHPENISKKVHDITGKDITQIVDYMYQAGPNDVRSPYAANLNAIKSDERYKSYQCSDSNEYLRPHKSSNYHDNIYDRYQDICHEKEARGERLVRPLKEHRDLYAFYGPIDFLFRGVGPIPGPAPLAVISAVVCFGLMATGVGAIGIAAVAITFSAVSGAVQAYKSAQENGLDMKKTIAAVLLGAAAGVLAPWPGLGPLMSAAYVKVVEKGLKMGKKAMDIHFPKKNDEVPEKKHTQEQDRGVEVLHKKEKGVEVASVPKEERKAVVRGGVGSTVKERLGDVDMKRVEAIAGRMSSNGPTSSPGNRSNSPSKQQKEGKGEKKNRCG